MSIYFNYNYFQLKNVCFKIIKCVLQKNGVNRYEVNKLICAQHKLS